MSKRYASAQYTRVYEDPEDRKRKEFENDDSLFAGMPYAKQGMSALERRKAAPLQRWRLPPPRRLRYRSGQKNAFTAFSCLAVAMGLAGAPYDPFEERYPDRKHREASWQKLAARYVSPVL